VTSVRAEFRSLLYSEPRLYELVFPDDPVTDMVNAAIPRYLTAPPRSMLDVGCGTARHLEAMSATIPDCWGVDLLETNIAYARSVRPRLTLHVGDMRTVRLGRRFDLITCFGNALSYALTDDDLGRTMDTFAAHARAGTLLVLDVLNARSYLDGDGFRGRIEGSVETPEFKATSVSIHTLDRAARILTRIRTWRIEGRANVEDDARYRLLHPEELKRQLEVAGFECLDVFDNREFAPTDLGGRVPAVADLAGMRGRKLYAFARRR